MKKRKLIGCVGHDCAECAKRSTVERAAMRWYRNWIKRYDGPPTKDNGWNDAEIALFKACKARAAHKVKP